MSSVVTRRVASTPVRTAAETWELIMEILAPDADGDARRELAKATGVACSSISSEATRDAAIVTWCGGPHARIYCIFDDDAITSDRVNENPLPRSPTEGDWRMSIPCLPEDVKWSNDKLTAVSSRIGARSLNDDIDDEPTSGAFAHGLSIDVKEFLKP